MSPFESPTKIDLSWELDPRDYAQGKSRDEEARDSAQMLVYGLIFAAVTAIGLASHACR